MAARLTEAPPNAAAVAQPEPTKPLPGEGRTASEEGLDPAAFRPEAAAFGERRHDTSPPDAAPPWPAPEGRLPVFHPGPPEALGSAPAAPQPLALGAAVAPDEVGGSTTDLVAAQQLPAAGHRPPEGEQATANSPTGEAAAAAAVPGVPLDPALEVDSRARADAPPLPVPSPRADSPGRQHRTADAPPARSTPSGFLPERFPEPAAALSRESTVASASAAVAAPDWTQLPAGGANADQSSVVSPPAPPEALPPAVRRFLQPLVGIDPTTVAVYRGGPAQAAAADLNADAFVAGDQVALGTADALTAPRTLGLLAHELTHVARRRSPRFVPPIVQPPPAWQAPVAGSAVAGGPIDDEALARQVEARVTAQAMAADAVVTPAAQPAGGVIGVRPALPADDSRPSMPALAGGPVAALAPATSWSGLPAPWEPLPAWMAPSAPSGTSTRGMLPTVGVATTAPMVDVAAPIGQTPVVTAAANVQRAEHDRSPATNVPPPAPPALAAPAPDLDVLAQQVYAVLKRRLAVERRRLG